ncbi:MAG TPA: PAS domain-containing protein [Anaerolineales bacterium]|jgi:PAS domain S-box-containing protein
MTLAEFLTLLTRLVFTLVALVTLVQWIRRRDATRLDIAAVFVSLSLSVMIQGLEQVIGRQFPWLEKLGTFALLAHPYFLLRIAHYFQPVRPWVRRAALLGLAVSWAAIALSGATLAPALTLVIVAYFASVEIYATLIFIRGAFSTSGITRQRLRLASLASGLLAGIILLAGVLVAVPEQLRSALSPIIQALALLAGLSYYLGFAPPRWLSQTWQLTELHRYLRETSGHWARVPSVTFDHLSKAAARAVGGIAAAIAVWDFEANHLKIDAPGEPAWHVDRLEAQPSALSMSWRQRVPRLVEIPREVPAEAAAWAQGMGAQSLLIVPVVSGSHAWAMLIVALRHEPLFVEDDLNLLSLLAGQSAIVLDYARLLDDVKLANQALEQRARELSQANSLLQTLMDSSPDHIYFKDEHGRFIRNSRSQAEMLGLPDSAAAIGKSDFDFFPAGHAQRSFTEEQQVMRTGEPLVGLEERVQWPDGRVTWVSTTKMPLLDHEGRVIGTFGISRDITARKEAEDRLEQSNVQLASANQELEAFSYSVSHDLRAPLRSIDGFSQAFLEDYGDKIPAEGRSYLDRTRAAAQRMAALIDDLLALSRVSRANVDRSAVDLSGIAAGIAAELQREQPRRQVEFVIAPGMSVQGDENLLRIALQNLLANAWKFTSKQPTARIEFGIQPSDEAAIFFVRDNGSGFDMTYVDKLFGAFQRLHSNEQFPGTGIGLATVQRIFRKHGGRAWAQGAVDQGATFYFTL